MQTLSTSETSPRNETHEATTFPIHNVLKRGGRQKEPAPTPRSSKRSAAGYRLVLFATAPVVCTGPGSRVQGPGSRVQGPGSRVGGGRLRV
eukprot:3423759-Rhodomonas_salina.5